MAFQPKIKSNLGSILNPKMENKNLLNQSEGRKTDFNQLQSWRAEHGDINQRQSQVERHKAKMFDPHERTIGVDLRGIEAQVRAKQAKKLNDQAEEALINEEINRAAKRAEILEERRVHDVKMRERALTKFWIPKKCPDVPKMYCDSEALSLKFHGEDLKIKEREAFQKEQNREWLLQQMEEKRCRELQQRDETFRYDDARMKMDCVALQMEAELREARKTMARCYAGANLLMAGQKGDECDDDCDKRREIANLTLGCGFVPNDDLTGMDLKRNADLITRNRITPKERAKQMAMESDLKSQIQDIEMRKKKEAAEEAEKNAWLLKADRSAVLQQRKIETIEKELRKQRQQENLVMAEKQRQKAATERCLNTNEPSAEYFDQFNKCRVR